MAIEWGVSLLRLSIFSSGPTSISDNDWKMLTGQEEAENRTAIPGGRRYSGKYANGSLTLASTADRLDMVLQAQPPQSEEELRLPLIGPWSDVRGTFIEMCHRLLTSTQAPIVRVAFGGVLLSPSSDKEDSYRRLNRLLTTIDIDPVKMRDLFYRINWPSTSNTTGHLLNRITTWATIKFAVTLMQVTGDRISVAAGAEKEVHAVRLEFDNNTDAESKSVIDKASIVPVFDELVSLANENAEKGEIQS